MSSFTANLSQYHIFHIFLEKLSTSRIDPSTDAIDRKSLTNYFDVIIVLKFSRQSKKGVSDPVRLLESPASSSSLGKAHFSTDVEWPMRLCFHQCGTCGILYDCGQNDGMICRSPFYNYRKCSHCANRAPK